MRRKGRWFWITPAFLVVVALSCGAAEAQVSGENIKEFFAGKK